MRTGWGPLFVVLAIRGLAACVPDTTCAETCSDDELCVDGVCVEQDDASEGEGEGEAGGTWGDVCDDVTPCADDLACGVFTFTCAEPCASVDECDACTAVTGAACICSDLGFCLTP